MNAEHLARIFQTPSAAGIRRRSFALHSHGSPDGSPSKTTTSLSRAASDRGWRARRRPSRREWSANAWCLPDNANECEICELTPKVEQRTVATHQALRVPQSAFHNPHSALRNLQSRAGSALIVALWVIILLTLIVGSFAFDMHIEARITSYARKRLHADRLAQAGIERARMLLVKSGEQDVTKEDYAQKDAPWYSHAKNLARGSAVYGVTDTLRTGTVTIDIVPEVARRNVNRLGREDWERIMKAAGIPEELQEEIMDCIEDWIDPDNTPRAQGAENDYYGNLEKPYTARNGPIFTVDELLSVKGITQPMLYGGWLSGGNGEDAEEEPIVGMADLLTTFGDDKVNVNAAPERVLMTLPGVDEATAEEIVADREGYPQEDAPQDPKLFESMDDFFKRFPNLRSSMQDHITTAAGIYRITSIGRSQGVERQVSCTVSVDRQSGKMTALRWLESERQ